MGSFGVLDLQMIYFPFELLTYTQSVEPLKKGLHLRTAPQRDSLHSRPIFGCCRANGREGMKHGPMLESKLFNPCSVTLKRCGLSLPYHRQLTASTIAYCIAEYIVVASR